MNNQVHSEEKLKVLQSVVDLVDEKDMSNYKANLLVLTTLVECDSQPLAEINTIDDLKEVAGRFDTASDFWEYCHPHKEQPELNKMSVFGALSALAYHVRTQKKIEEPRGCFDLIWNEVYEAKA